MTSEKSTVLYIDDELINLEIFKESFCNKYNVIILSSTHKAIEVLKKNKVKVIVADQNMPEETGLEFIKRINKEFPDVIKMIFTAYSSEEIALKAINDANIYKFLLKPWDFNEIDNAIAIAIKEYDVRLIKNELLLELQKRNETIIEAYRKLEENEKKFYAVFANSNDGIYVLNFSKEIIEANKAFTSIVGYDEFPCNFFNLNSFIKTQFPILIDKSFELSKSNFDLEIIVNSTERKSLEISSNKISYNNESYILSVVRDISDRKLFEKKIVEAIIHTQEEDQSKYARELHDGLGPLLSTLKMHIEWIANPDNSNNKDKIIQHSIHVIDNAIRSVKEIANNLSPHVLQRFGLVNALTSYIENIKQTTNIEFSINSNLNERLKSNVELVLFRVILECINNTVKHSKAKKINIKFGKQNNFLFIGYSDNGKGFDVSKELKEGHGMGLFNIQNRVKHVNGEVEIISNNGVGTDINITVDLK